VATITRFKPTGIKIVRVKFGNIPEMPCKYCIYWREAKRFGFQDEDEENESEKQTRRTTAGTRKCTPADKEVKLTDPSCPDFVMYHNFWCNKNEQWKHIYACISCQKKVFGEYEFSPECKNCRQGILLWKFVEATQLHERSKIL